MPPSKVARRMERLLAIVPYVIRHPGTTLEDLGRLFDVDPRSLIRDLNLLFMTGLPPYDPGNLIEVDIEDGRVWIGMADYFGRPVRLTQAEALALYLKGTVFLGAQGLAEAEALRSALDKLKEHLGETLGELQIEAGEGKPSGPLDAVRGAVERREALEVDYYSASRDEVATRRIDPEHVFSALGNWYAVAWDHLREEERLFRIDRIREARRTGEGFEPRGLPGPGRPLYTPTDRDVAVRLRLGPRARWVAEYYEVEDERERDGDLEVTVPTPDLAWVAKLVLRVGSEVEVLDPPELRDMAAGMAEETLALYV
ncbi:MAG TPA: WYL domain-containing protein [Actinomycetota bacterium]|nr:WYL domain-containing protein [Actinomycetota bacterium]